MRNQALDGLRAIAAITVVAFHSKMPGFRGGFIGVDVFFVLSGYLITRLLLAEHHKNGRINFKRFWLRRLARLYPALILMLLAFVCVSSWVLSDAELKKEVLWSASYLSNFSMAYFNEPQYTSHTWTLAVEMQFYLFWPLVIVFLASHQNEKISLILASLFLIVTTWRMYSHHVFGWQNSYYSFDTRASGLVLGSLLATINWRLSSQQLTKIGYISALVLIVLSTQLKMYNSTAVILTVLVELAAAGVVLTALSPNSLSKFLSHPILVKIGIWSYGLYLWHYPVVRIFRDEMNGYATFGITLSISLLLSALSYEFYERVLTKYFHAKIDNKLKTKSSAMSQT